MVMNTEYIILPVGAAEHIFIKQNTGIQNKNVQN
jgi:hypothetical protein